MLSRNAPSPVTARAGWQGPARAGLGATTVARASTALTTALLAATALTLAALSACTPDDGATPTGSPTAAPTSVVPTRPAPTGSTAEPTTAPAEDSGLLLIPQQLNGFAIEGQEVVFLVALADSFATDSGGPGPGGSGDAPGGSDQSDTRRASASDLPITITAEAANATVTVLEPTLAEAADIAEVIVVPDPGSTGSTVTLTITGTGTGADVTVTASASFDVVEGVDDRAADAERIRDLFIPWLAENRPELEITAATPWSGTIVSPQWLVVSHYLFLTAEWEMHVEWHIMVAPDDWARIDLRRRFEEVAPSRAFEISSVTEGGEPHEIDPPETIWR